MKNPNIKPKKSKKITKGLNTINQDQKLTNKLQQNNNMKCVHQQYQTLAGPEDAHHWRSGHCGLSATWQELYSRSTTDSSTQVCHWCSCTFFDWTIQSFTDNRLRPSRFKTAYISPHLKKVDLDPSDIRSYRSISNPPVFSKLHERLVTRQLLAHLNSNGLLPRLQSAYQAHHSTETAVLKVLMAILRAVDVGVLSALVLLDQSASFHTVDHGILLHQLVSSYQIVGSVQQWFQSYLSNRLQHVRVRSSSSSPCSMVYPRVPFLVPYFSFCAAATCSW